MEHTLVGQKWQTPLLLQKLRQPSQNKSVNGTQRFSAQGYMQLVSCGLATSFFCAYLIWLYHSNPQPKHKSLLADYHMSNNYDVGTSS